MRDVKIDNYCLPHFVDCGKTGLLVVMARSAIRENDRYDTISHKISRLELCGISTFLDE